MARKPTYDELEKRVRELEVRFRADRSMRDLVEYPPRGIFLIDPSGTVLFANRMGAQRLGKEPKEIIGTSLRDCFLPDISEKRPLKGIEALQTQPPQTLEDHIGNRWYRSISRRLQNQLLQAQKLEAVATLTGGIAHDYNNLLSVVMGNLALAIERVETGSDQAGFLKEADKAAKRVKDLTHELMALSRGGAPVKEDRSYKALLRNSSSVIPVDSGISLEESIPEDLWPVPHDAYQIDAVFRNVLTNAGEAMPQGGTVTLAAENFRIDDPTQKPGQGMKAGDYVKITINDQGVGIAEEHLCKIFDPYFSTRPMGVQKGMGLGLATAHAIVQKHGGHIAVESVPGEGTTVSIHLPAERAEGEAQRAEHPEPDFQLSIVNPAGPGDG